LGDAALKGGPSARRAGAPFTAAAPINWCLTNHWSTSAPVAVPSAYPSR